MVGKELLKFSYTGLFVAWLFTENHQKSVFCIKEIVSGLSPSKAPFALD